MIRLYSQPSFNCQNLQITIVQQSILFPFLFCSYLQASTSVSSFGDIFLLVTHFLLRLLSFYTNQFVFLSVCNSQSKRILAYSTGHRNTVCGNWSTVCFHNFSFVMRYLTTELHNTVRIQKFCRVHLRSLLFLPRLRIIHRGNTSGSHYHLLFAYSQTRLRRDREVT